jgi:hypothetical protein
MTSTAKTYEMHMFHSASPEAWPRRAVLSQNRIKRKGREQTNKTKEE